MFKFRLCVVSDKVTQGAQRHGFELQKQLTIRGLRHQTHIRKNDTLFDGPSAVVRLGFDKRALQPKNGRSRVEQTPKRSRTLLESLCKLSRTALEGLEEKYLKNVAELFKIPIYQFENIGLVEKGKAANFNPSYLSIVADSVGGASAYPEHLLEIQHGRPFGWIRVRAANKREHFRAKILLVFLYIRCGMDDTFVAWFGT